MEKPALEQVAGAIRLSDAEKKIIRRPRREERLLVCADGRAHVEVIASLDELRILDPQAYKERTGRPV